MVALKINWKNLGFWIPIAVLAILIFVKFGSRISEKKPESLNPAETIPYYSFIQYDQNKLQFPGGSKSFNKFFAKLDSLTFFGEGKVNVLHIGGSHVQAGTLTNRMRENLFTLADGIKGERGFIFPFKMANTNNPRNYKVVFTGKWQGCRNAIKKNHCPWGLSGITATTYDTLTTAKVYAFDKDSVVYSFNRVRIYHLATPESFHAKLDSSMGVDSVWTDSLAGVTTFQLNRYYDTLFFKTVKTDSLQSYFVMQGIKLESGRSGLSYTAIGVNGAKVPSYLRCQYFEPQLETVVPDLVIFGIGINDAYMPEDRFSPEEYENNYRELISMFKKANPDVQFIFMTNNDSYYKRRYPNANALKVQMVMKKLATDYGAAYWDLFEIMGGLNSVKMWRYEGLAKRDLIHFTPAGYVLQADLLFKAIRNAYGDYLLKNNEQTQ